MLGPLTQPDSFWLTMMLPFYQQSQPSLLDLLPKEFIKGKGMHQFHCPWGMSLGWAPISSLLQEVGTKRNASILQVFWCTESVHCSWQPLKSIFECGGEPNTFSRLWLKPVQINKNQLLIHKAESCLHLGKVTLSPYQDHWKVTDSSKWGTCSFSQLYLTSPLHPSPLYQAETSPGCKWSQVQTSPFMSNTQWCAGQGLTTSSLWEGLVGSIWLLHCCKYSHHSQF